MVLSDSPIHYPIPFTDWYSFFKDNQDPVVSNFPIGDFRFRKARWCSLRRGGDLLRIDWKALLRIVKLASPDIGPVTEIDLWPQVGS